MDNILFIPGIANPVSEINSLLFGAGQQGTFIAPSLTASLISGSTFGTGVETLPDLSPRNNPFSQATSGSRGAWFREPKTGTRNLVPASSETINWAAGDPVTFGSYVDGPMPGTQARQVFGMTTSTTDSPAAENIRAFNTGNTINAQVGVVYTRSLYLRRITPGSHTANLRVLTNVTSTIASATVTHTEWTRLSVTSTGTSTGLIRAILGGGGDADGVLVAGDMIEISAAPTAFQKVVSPFDVTESGQRDCYGVRLDGIDDGYQTAGNVDFSGTDKVTVFWAGRKFSDAAAATMVELTTNSAVTNGAFRLVSSAANNANYLFNAAGSTFPASIVTPNSFAAPITNVVTAFADISTPFRFIRVNGTEQISSSASMGTGNFSNNPLFLFARSGLVTPFNGNLYALIVAGGSYPLSTIQRVKRLLSRITPTVNL
jgi:hypothetical protein